MLVNGFILATLTVSGFYLIYRKLPMRLRRFMEKHSLMTDIVACVLTYILFGGTLVALFASAWVGIMISILLALVQNQTTAAAMETITLKLILLKDKFLKALEAFVKNNQQPQVASIDG